MHNFKKLEVWQRAVDYSVKIRKVVKKFPKHEQFVLSNQIVRGADSMALNISEGAGSNSDIEFGRFLNMAFRSTYEVITGLEIAYKSGYLEKDDLEKLVKEAEEIGAMIRGLMNTLKKS